MARRGHDPPFHGILNLNKPKGATSFAMVTLVRRLTGFRRVGHAGTLDPIAEGVLPILLGQATRVMEYLVDQPKVYLTTLRLGQATDTYDAEGAVTAEADCSGVTREALEEVAAAFTGEVEQLPPMYSAVKRHGQPLYRYARAGEEVERAPRRVVIYRIDVVSFEPPFATIEVECGRGAYVRTLAHDIGLRLGCYAHLAALTRLRAGPFGIEDAVTPDELREAALAGTWQDLLRATDTPLESWRAAILGPQHTRAAREGRPLFLAPAHPGAFTLPAGTLCRAYSTEGDFLAVLRYEGGQLWQPDKVFAPFPQPPEPRK